MFLTAINPRTISFASCPTKRGESRSSRSRGGLRWTPMVLKTTAPEAYGKDVWARHPDAGVKFAASELRMTVAKSPVAEVSTL